MTTEHKTAAQIIAEHEESLRALHHFCTHLLAVASVIMITGLVAFIAATMIGFR